MGSGMQHDSTVPKVITMGQPDEEAEQVWPS
jgi:hypothetical protein